MKGCASQVVSQRPPVTLGPGFMRPCAARTAARALGQPARGTRAMDLQQTPAAGSVRQHCSARGRPARALATDVTARRSAPERMRAPAAFAQVRFWVRLGDAVESMTTDSRCARPARRGRSLHVNHHTFRAQRAVTLLGISSVHLLLAARGWLRRPMADAGLPGHPPPRSLQHESSSSNTMESFTARLPAPPCRPCPRPPHTAAALHGAGCTRGLRPHSTAPASLNIKRG